MKLKCQPEDFRVEELPTVAPGERGRFMFYRLTKRNLGTIEAIAAIRRRWNLDPRQVSTGGLKDRHALTIQYLTIADGPSRSITRDDFTLEPLGKLATPYSSSSFLGNRFDLVIRDLAPQAAEACLRALETAPRDGLPNYFDDQRFGSVGRSQEFIGEAWLRGDHERALKLVLAEDNDFDRSGAREIKQLVREHWGDWATLKARLDRCSTRSIVTYLVDHPSDFAGAFARLPRELRSLYFSAFQSYLWNAIVSRFLETTLPESERGWLELKLDRLACPAGVSEASRGVLAGLTLTLPCARSPEPGEPMGESARAVLAGAGLSWRDLRVKKLKDVFLSKGSRDVLFWPGNLRFEALDDALYPRRRAIRLGFELGRGSYATILVKRIAQLVGPEARAGKP